MATGACAEPAGPRRAPGVAAGAGCAVLALLLLSGCVAQSTRDVHLATCRTFAQGLPPGDAPPDTLQQMGPVLVVGPLNAQKSARKMLLASFHLDANGEFATQKHTIQVAYGTGGTPVSERCDFSFELLDEDGELLAIYGIPDPREVFVDEHAGYDDVPSRLDPDREVTFVARFPFTVKAAAIRLIDFDGTTTRTLDIGAAIDLFCRSHEKDQDCEPVLRK